MSAEQPELEDRPGAPPDPGDQGPDALAAAAERSAPVADESRPGFTDTLTLAFTDIDGIAGLVVAEYAVGAPAAGGAAAPATGGAAALLFADGRRLAAPGRGDLEPAEPAWDALSTEQLELAIAGDPWRVAIRAGDATLELELAASGEPSGFDVDSPVGRVSGLARTQRRCDVSGTALIAGETRRLAGTGERVHQWGPPPWDRLEAWREFGAWLGDDLSLALWSGRPAGATLDREALAARVIEGEPPRAYGVGEPRLSIAYDAEGELLRAGLELWVGAGDEFARRAAGERLAAGSLSLRGSRHRWALLDCRLDGRAGPGALHVATPDTAARARP